MAYPLFLQRIWQRSDHALDCSKFPLSLPFVQDLDLEFTSSVTFFVGENGSGKSTLMEAIAQLCNLPVGGGGRNELAGFSTPDTSSELALALKASFRRRPKDGYFFRAEYQAHFASLLEQREADPDFFGNPFPRFGGRSLHMCSHGEAFLNVFSAWMNPGIILMDEPEAALSPQRQLALLMQMAKLERQGGVQFIIATHSPIMLTFPGATILSFDAKQLKSVCFEDTDHYQITRGILESPDRYWNYLLCLSDEDGY
jgi:predicted ATPase